MSRQCWRARDNEAAAAFPTCVPKGVPFYEALGSRRERLEAHPSVPGPGTNVAESPVRLECQKHVPQSSLTEARTDSQQSLASIGGICVLRRILAYFIISGIGKVTRLDSGRLANLAFFALLLALAALWLVFRPVQLSASSTSFAEPAFDTSLAELEPPVLAFCRTGTGSASLWALWVPPSDILSTTRAAGYDLDLLAPRLDAGRRRANAAST